MLLTACQSLRRVSRELPSTPLTIDAPIGWGTRSKLVALGEDTPRCLALLDAASVRHDVLPPVRQDQCGYADGVRLGRGGALPVTFHPGGPAVACPVAVALVIWQRQIVQPAAQRHFGRAVTGIDHYGSFACRRINGRSTGDFSEHSTARAIDIAGFRLAGGSTVTVRRDWNGAPARAAFLREVRDGGCRLFSTVLSPDFNASHADHLHLDHARRGLGGYCR
ncbi:extensin family protein [Polymorphobacter fuscus]|uniref:extensin-like domain-containing protein n=1 Tax=Sandarakinorhabdus fusca TaxID=1439888 RepID=UPI001FB060E4|nr:extensin family protein [Polymorphobacter fuscus]